MCLMAQPVRSCAGVHPCQCREMFTKQRLRRGAGNCGCQLDLGSQACCCRPLPQREMERRRKKVESYDDEAVSTTSRSGSGVDESLSGKLQADSAACGGAHPLLFIATARHIYCQSWSWLKGTSPGLACRRCHPAIFRAVQGQQPAGQRGVQRNPATGGAPSGS